MGAEPIAFGAADISNCDREQIHIPGAVQPHGCLLAMTPGDLRIVRAGGNTQALLGAEPQDLLGVPLDDIVSAQLAKTIHAVVEAGSPERRLVPLDSDLTARGCDPDAYVHMSGGLLILELEQASEGFSGDAFAVVHDLVSRVQQTNSVEAFCQAMVDCIRQVSGFDRVMLYRFLQDGSGAVDAESSGEGVEPYLGLRYPASDIPNQARDLYLRNTVRIIPDAGYRPAPLLAAPGPTAATTLDLTFSVLRSVSPIHLTYLANMGVVGSMSLSVVVDGRLWGLVACHHRTARFLPVRLRVALDLFCQMASFQLETRLGAEDLAGRMQRKAIHETLIADLAGRPDINLGLRDLRESLLNYIPAAGLALWIDGNFATIGQTPNEAQVRRLVEWLNNSVREGTFCTDRLAEEFPADPAFVAVGAGILALSVSRSPRDYLIWFRPEMIETVRWAGDPDKAVTAGDPGQLSPRASFAQWRQMVRRRSEPWVAADVKTAETLRVSLLEVVLEHVDQLARERQSARIQQDALVAQLDARIAQWEQTAAQLKEESDRRAVLEVELSQVLRRTVIDQEAERQRIARELHDSLGQFLTAMQLDLDGISRDGSASASIRERVTRLQGMTIDAGHEVNYLAWEIRPTALDDLGLQTAFEQFLEEWSERSPLKIDLHLTLDNRRLTPAVETALYRVLQEAFRNIVKHAEASHAGVILEATAHEVRLIVEDDGKGFLMDESRSSLGASSRLGLLGMRERIALVGGTLEVETAPGQGTTLLIHVPL